MKKIVGTISMGVGVWAVPFAFGMLLLPVRQSNPALFDSLMTISLCVGVVLLFSLYRRFSPDTATHTAAAVGLLWAAIAVAIDLPIFIKGLGMELGTYFSDIGISYLIVPVVVVGMAQAAQWRTS